MPETVLIKYILIWTVVTFLKPRCMTIGSITRKAKNKRQKTVWNALTSYWPSKRPSPAKTDSATHETSIQNTDCKALSLPEICLKKGVFVFFVFGVKLISEALSCVARFGNHRKAHKAGVKMEIMLPAKWWCNQKQKSKFWLNLFCRHLLHK